MTRARFALLAIVAGLAGCGGPAIPPAQNYATITGRVYDADSNAPVAGAVVTGSVVLNATSATDGTYRITNFPIGPNELQVAPPNGYHPAQAQYNISPQAGETLTVNIGAQKGTLTRALHATRVIVAPDKFKGSADAVTVGEAIVAGLRDVWGDAPAYVIVPMADGGEGTVDAFLASGAVARRVSVRGPLDDSVVATYARDGDTAIIEMAAASGLALLGSRRAPMRATTYGTGELIADALDGGATRIVLGIGGSATTDGGTGALAALGVRFYDRDDCVLEPQPAALSALARIDLTQLHPALASAAIAIACDVDNPLLGPTGAAAIYGPQKGADREQILALDTVLALIANVAVEAGRPDFRALPGAGAAGGLGWGLATFAGARLSPGFSLIAEQRSLANALQTATLCLTGEGRIDGQTLRGKVVAGIATLAQPLGVPVVAFGGSVDPAAESDLHGLGVVCLPICDGPMTLAEAMERAPALVRAAAARFARIAQLD